MKHTLLLIATVWASYTGTAQNFTIATGEPLHSQQTEMDVKGRNGILIKQKLSFGDYHTTRVKRSAIRKWTGTTGSPGTIWKEHMEGRQSIHFGLTNGADTSNVMTVTNVTTNDLLIGHSGHTTRLRGSLVPLAIKTDIAQNNYSVSIATYDGDEPWELFLDNIGAQVRRKEPAGYVSRGEKYYTIEPVWQVEKKNGKVADMPFGASGFEIKDGEKVMAAVSLMNNGKVYLGPGTSEQKFLFANVCSALLLQSVID